MWGRGQGGLREAIWFGAVKIVAELGAVAWCNAMDAPLAPRRENALLCSWFFAALLAHAVLVTFHWQVPYLAGHEFRQTLTATTTRYIDQDNNFSLLYEVPVLGKPWISVLLEVPFYEWAVVGLSRVTGWPHFLAARTITLGCFYLTLPALYLLLGALIRSGPRRLLVLALVLTCPVYIFYSRAFLMESMELMFCAWFLLGYWRTMERRSYGWLAFTIIAGTLGALLKSATLAAWLLPAASYGVWALWQDWRTGKGWISLGKTAAWSLATVVVGLGALRWWIAVTDPIKAAHSSAWIMTSQNLSEGNWGLFSFSRILSLELWRTLLQRWSEAFMPPWLLLGMLVAGLLLGRSVRLRVLALLAVFFWPQLLFPTAYAYQDYYYYACGVFLLAGLGLFLLALLDSRWPRLLVWLLIALPFAAQMHTYWRGYREQQALVGTGQRTFTEAVKDVTPPGSVIVVAGADWAPIVPYYAERRALMIRNGLEYNPAYLTKALAELADEDVSTLVVCDVVRNYPPFLDQVTKALDMEPVPTFRTPSADVYLRRLYIKGAEVYLRNSRKFGDLTVNDTPEMRRDRYEHAFNAATGADAFPMVKPAPHQCSSTYGLTLAERGGERVISAHPDSELWLRPPVGAKTIYWEFGMEPAAYERAGDKTNGVEQIVTGIMPDGQTREIYRRVLEPVQRSADRGRQKENIAYAPRPGEVLRFASLPNGSSAFDWTYWARIEVK